MGDWSYEPTGNDYAEDWIENSVACPLTDAIKSTLVRYLEDPSDDVNKLEAEAAAALLVDFTANAGGFKYLDYRTDILNTVPELLDKAIAAIKGLLSEDNWLAGYSNPQTKTAVLHRLLSELESQRASRPPLERGKG